MSTAGGSGGRPKGDWRGWYREHHRGFWWAVASCWIVGTIVLGLWGWHIADDSASPLDLFYTTVAMFWMQGSFDGVSMPWQLELSRYTAAVVLLAGVSLAFLALFRDEIRRWRVRRLSGHTIVCGLGEKGLQVVRALRRADEHVVVVLLDAESDKLPIVRGLGAFDLVADATEQRTLRMAGIAKASQLFVLCPEDHVNVAIAQAARRTLDEISTRSGRVARRRKPLRCAVLIGDPVWWQQLDPLKVTTGSESVAVEYFNLAERAADGLVLAHPPQRAAERDGRPARVALVGDGVFARAVAGELVGAWAGPDGSSSPLELQLWCAHAGDVASDLRRDYPNCDSGGRVSLVAVPGAGALDEPVVTLAALSAAIPPEEELYGLDCVYVCLDADHRNVAVALVVDEVLRTGGGPVTDVVACLTNADALGRVLAERHEARGTPHERLVVFDVMKTLRDPDLLFSDFHEAFARSVHERFCRDNPGDAVSSVSWNDLPEDLREQNRGQAADFWKYLERLQCEVTRRRALGDPLLVLSDDEVDQVAGDEHARWMAGRLAAGWTWGPAPKDPDRKTNPLLKPWDALDAREKQKTIRQIREIPEILAEAGYHVFRSPAVAAGGQDTTAR